MVRWARGPAPWPQREKQPLTPCWAVERGPQAHHPARGSVLVSQPEGLGDLLVTLFGKDRVLLHAHGPCNVIYAAKFSPSPRLPLLLRAVFWFIRPWVPTPGKHLGSAAFLGWRHERGTRNRSFALFTLLLSYSPSCAASQPEPSQFVLCVVVKL